MKIKLILWMCLFPSIAISQAGNDIVIKKDFIQYAIESEKNIFTTYYNVVYEICNVSDSIVWLWFEEKDSLSDAKKLTEYFFRSKGDINLFHILTDVNVSVAASPPILFNTFLKYIKVQDSFTIQIFFTEKISDKKKEAIFNYLDEHIVIVSNERLSEFLGIKNITKWNRMEFYKGNFISIPLSLLNIK